jgi:NTE family protein
MATRIGLALGSGGARGLAHCGVLEVLVGADVPIACMAGTSMGAIVGALHAREPDAGRVWRHLEAYIEDREFADYWSAFVPRHNGEEREDARPWSGLYDFMHRGRVAVRALTTESADHRERLHGPLSRLFPPDELMGDLSIPLRIVALDLVTGAMVAYDDGPVLDALYASCAIPGVFPPATRNGHLVCDAGGPFRTPVEACRAMGADVVVAVDIPAYQEPQLRTGFDIGLRSTVLALDRLNDTVLAGADVVIRPAVSHVHWADFKAGREIREAGRVAARAALPELDRARRDADSPWRQIVRQLPVVRNLRS